MKINIVFKLFFVLFSITSFGQNKEIRIGPGPIQKQPEPVVIYDGIRVPSMIIKDIFNEENKEINDSVSIQLDSIFDCNGVLTNLGIVKIYTKDSMNLGAKKILALTNDCLYENPLTKLIINKVIVDWNEETFYKLKSLKPEDIIYAKVLFGKKDKCDMTLKLKLKE